MIWVASYKVMNVIKDKMSSKVLFCIQKQESLHFKRIIWTLHVRFVSCVLPLLQVSSWIVAHNDFEFVPLRVRNVIPMLQLTNQYDELSTYADVDDEMNDILQQHRKKWKKNLPVQRVEKVPTCEFIILKRSQAVQCAVRDMCLSSRKVHTLSTFSPIVIKCVWSYDKWSVQYLFQKSCVFLMDTT